jgi:hypothetical protein
MSNGEPTFEEVDVFGVTAGPRPSAGAASQNVSRSGPAHQASGLQPISPHQSHGRPDPQVPHHVPPHMQHPEAGYPAQQALQPAPRPYQAYPQQTPRALPMGAEVTQRLNISDLPGSKILTLTFPIEWRGAQLKELAMRRPIGRDMHAMPSSGDPSAEEMFPFFALICGVEDELIDELDSQDLNGIGSFIESCSSGSRKSGKKAAGLNREATVILEYPIVADGKTVSSISVRRPKGKDMRELPKGSSSSDPTSMFGFYAQVCGIPAALFESMDLADIGAISEVCGTFLRSQKTKKAT